MGINYPASRHLAFATSGIDKRRMHLPMRQLTLFEAYAIERPAAVGRSVGGEQHLPGLIRLGFGLGLGLGLGLRFGCWFSTGK